MGVSIYVMPLTRYLIGAFKTVWENAPEAGPSPGRRRLELESAERYLEAIQAELPVSFDEETRPALAAVAMSAESFGDMVASASPDLGRVRALGDVFLWLPAEFEGLRELPDPFDEDGVISAGSAPGLHRELGRLAEVQSPRLVVGTLLRLAAQAIEHRLPMIVEG